MNGLYQLALKVQERFFYGWVVAGVAALGMFASGPGQSHIFSVFNGLIAADLNLSASSVSTAYGLATLVAAFGLPYVGQLVDKFGPRRVQIVLLSVAAIGVLIFAFGQDAMTLVFGRALIGLGFAGGLMASFKAVVIWIPEPRRALANALVMSSGAIGLLLATQPLEFVTQLFGWRDVFLALAGGG